MNFKMIIAILIVLISGLGIGYFLGVRSNTTSAELSNSSNIVSPPRTASISDPTTTPATDSSPSTTTLSDTINTLPVDVGIGIMGDSSSDEYRADDFRGGLYATTTLNWMEQLVLDRGLNFGPWGSWGEPRRTGYKYNWARSGATAASLLESGQHTGLAQQVADGEVSMIILWIGDNDFHWKNGPYQEIYDGTLSDIEIEAKVQKFISDVTTAVDTVLSAGDVQMVVVTVLDQGTLPWTVKRYPDSAKRQRVTDAVNQINDGIRELAADRGIAIADVNSISQAMLQRLDSKGFLDVGGEKINSVEKGDEPHFARLNDKSGHSGTVGSGLVANLLFIEPFNRHYGLDITPLSDEEILKNAGIH